MKYLLLTFDIEEFIPKECGDKANEEIFYEISKNGFNKILDLLKKNEIRATLFTTLKFAENFPTLIGRAINENCEIALHGYSHKHRYKKMPQKEALKYLSLAKKSLEENFKIKIRGFRAPQMSHPSYKLLKKIGIEYDSSYHPTYVPGHYNYFFKTRKIHLDQDVKIIPVSVTPLIRLPFSWVWFRNMPLIYSKMCTSLNLTNTNYINLYFHSWEFVSLNNQKYNKNISPLIIKNTGKQLHSKLQKYIQWCKKTSIKSTTISEYLYEQKI